MALPKPEFALKGIVCEQRDLVARITINRPKQLNAFTGDALKEPALALEDAGQSEDVRHNRPDGRRRARVLRRGRHQWEKEGGRERGDAEIGLVSMFGCGGFGTANLLAREA